MGRSEGLAQKAVKERLGLKTVVIRAKENIRRKGDRLRTLFFDWCLSQCQCGKTHLIILFDNRPKERSLERELARDKPFREEEKGEEKKRMIKSRVR